MMNITRALSISVSCLSLMAGSVFAYSFSGEYLSAPPPSILSSPFLKAANSHTLQIRKSPPARQVAESGLLVNGNFQNQSSPVMFGYSFSSVILGLAPRIQVKQGFLSHLDASVRHWHDNSAEMLRHEANASAQHDNFIQLVSVCFITDTGACSGNSFGGGANTENGGHGTPGGGSGDGGKDPDYEMNNAERCKKEGYTLKTCSSVQDAVNRCPYDTSFFEKCVCKSDLVTCTKPQYGVGESCGGKYASCQTDNPRACREDGYTNACASGQKLRKDRRCQYDSSFGICCTESCATNTSLTCTGANAGDDGCGYTCKQCCVTSCPSGYSYTESQLTGANGNGWVKDGNDYCDHCTRGKLYKRKAATCSVTQTCGCGGYNQCKSGSNTYYSSCNCCSNCGAYTLTSKTGCSYGYDSCTDKCTGKTTYKCRSCDNSCYGQTKPSCSPGETLRTSSDECGNTCYQCYCRDLACWENCVFANRTELFADESLSYYYYHCDYFLIDCHGSKILIETDSSIGHTQSTGSDPVTEFCEAY